MSKLDNYRTAKEALANLLDRKADKYHVALTPECLVRSGMSFELLNDSATRVRQCLRQAFAVYADEMLDYAIELQRAEVRNLARELLEDLSEIQDDAGIGQT